jgi:hypothetical protein
MSYILAVLGISIATIITIMALCFVGAVLIVKVLEIFLEDL